MWDWPGVDDIYRKQDKMYGNNKRIWENDNDLNLRAFLYFFMVVFWILPSRQMQFIAITVAYYWRVASRSYEKMYLFVGLQF